MRDSIHDTSLQTLHKLSKQFVDGLEPEYVKAASVKNEKPGDSVPNSAYADPVRKMFPCHSKVATWLSGLYYWGQKANGERWDGNMPEDKVADRIEKASRYWGIYPDVILMQQRINAKSASAKRRLTDSDYALVVNYGSERIRRFPIVNDATIKKAAANLRRFSTSYPYGWRKKAAENILKRAMAHSVPDIETEDLDYLFKAAGAYPQDSADVSTQLKIRTALYPDEVKPTLRKAAARLDDGVPANMDKICRIIDTLDRKYKKYPMYNSGMPMPEEVCFAGPSVKYASAAPVISLTTGTTYSLEDIKSAGIEPFSVLDDAYLTAIAANDQGDVDIEKAASILPTIPRDDATLLEQGLAAVGIKPLEKEARQDTEALKSMGGWMEYFGKPDDDWAGTFKLRSDQTVHDELKEKNKKQV
jgi:hypothetical protein